jgi:hypothetical protein
VVYASEENGEDPDFGRKIIDLKVEDETLIGHGANARSNLRVFCSAVRMRDECPHVDKGVVDPSRRSLGSSLKVLSEFLVGLNEMFFDKLKVACDIRGAADPITPHACCASA